MGKPYIVLGDKTSHGGTVVEGSTVSTIQGKPMALVGHKVTCPIPGHGTNPIVVGDPDFTIDGKAAARHGDTSACGATLIAAQAMTADETGGGGGGGSGSTAAGAGSGSASPATAAAATPIDPTAANETYTATLTVQNNSFGDTLPMIPKGARTKNKKVLFVVKLKAHVVDSKNAAAAGRTLVIKSANANDIVKPAGTTDANGDVDVELRTRDTGKVSLTSGSTDLKLAPFDLTITEAWYEDEFHITGYHVCDESDFRGDLVSAKGLTTKHKQRFLFGAMGVPMQGTGRSLDGKFIHCDSMLTSWKKDEDGHPDEVKDPDKVTFSVADAIHGRYAVLSENHSAAIDPMVIPPLSHFLIEDVGVRYGDDIGSRIRGTHIDNFVGSGNAVFQAWQSRGIYKKRVKFLGYRS